MKITVCDDETVQTELLKEMIEEWAENTNTDIDVKLYSSCDSLWWDMQDGYDPDLLLLDIQMKHMTGIELARKLRAEHNENQICFITGIKDYVFEGYDINAIGYILKPFDKDQILHMMNKAVRMMHMEERHLLLPVDEGTVRIKIHDIDALEARAHYTVFWLRKTHTNHMDSVLVKGGLNDWLNKEELKDFIKIHRSYAVNIQNICSVEKDGCHDGEGRVWPVSRTSRDIVMKAFIKAAGGHL